MDVIVLDAGLRDAGPMGADVRSGLDKLRTSLQVIHKQILDNNEARATKAMIATANAETCNVCEGDYVLWSRVDENHHPKLLVTWLGPYRVTEVNEYSIEIKHLLTKEKDTFTCPESSCMPRKTLKSLKKSSNTSRNRESC